MNNTGGPVSGPILDAKAHSFQAHLTSTWYVITSCRKPLFLRGLRFCHGRIINIISTSVKAPIRNSGCSTTTRWRRSSSSKKHWPAELAPSGITVNNILPGSVSTLPPAFHHYRQRRSSQYDGSSRRTVKCLLGDTHETFWAAAGSGRTGSFPGLARPSKLSSSARILQLMEVKHP